MANDEFFDEYLAAHGLDKSLDALNEGVLFPEGKQEMFISDIRFAASEKGAFVIIDLEGCGEDNKEYGHTQIFGIDQNPTSGKMTFMKRWFTDAGYEGSFEGKGFRKNIYDGALNLRFMATVEHKKTAKGKMVNIYPLGPVEQNDTPVTETEKPQETISENDVPF